MLEHTPETSDAWVSMLRTRFNGQPIAICLELNKGPMVSALRKYDVLVLFPSNPITLARYREAFTPAEPRTIPRTLNSSSHCCSPTVRSCSHARRRAPRGVPSHNSLNIAAV